MTVLRFLTVATILLASSIYATAASAQTTKPTCVPDKKYDAMLSAVRPAADQACRDQHAAWEQAECSDATFKKDWTAFVKRRKARLERYQVELDKMQGGSDTGNLIAIKAYVDGGYKRMDQGVVDKPSACVLKRRTVDPAAIDFSEISSNLGLWAAASGRLLVTENRKAYGTEEKCAFEKTMQAYNRAEMALELIKKLPAASKACPA